MRDEIVRGAKYAFEKSASRFNFKEILIFMGESFL